MTDKSFDGYDTFKNWLDATRVSLYEKVKDIPPRRARRVYSCTNCTDN